MSSPAPSSEPGPTFQRGLGLFDATMLVAGTMIGSGIFVVSADITRDMGSAGWLLAVWGLAGVMTFLGALCYAELAAMMPNAGGQYVYLREAYSPLWGFLYGWTCFLVIQTGSIAAVAVVFAKYFGVLVPALGTDANLPTTAEAIPHVSGFLPNLGWEPGTPHAVVVFARTYVDLKLSLPFMSEPFFTMEHFVVTAGQLVAVGLIVVLTWINCRGLHEGKLVQNIMTIAKSLALIALIIIGVAVVASPLARQANWQDAWSGVYETERFRGVSTTWGVAGLVGALMVMGGAMVGALFSADAWNNITFSAGEIRNPRQNLPRSLALGTGFVILLYILANVAYVEALPVRGDKQAAEKLEAKISEASREEAEELKRQAAFLRGIDSARDDRVGTAVLELWSPMLGAPLMAIAIMISTFGCNNGLVLMGARLYYVMAQDNLFFRSVGTLNRRAVPAVGLILQSAWSILLVFSGTYNDLLDYVIFAVLVFYVITVVGLFVLRRTRPDVERPVRALGYPVLPALYVLLCAAIMLDLLIVKPKFTWPGLIIVLAGIPVYFLWRLVSGLRR